jgi:ABC-type transporter Mla MlaB component
LARLPNIEATDEEKQALDSLLTAQNGDLGETGSSAGVKLADALRVRAGCLTAFLGSLALGRQWKDALDRAGLTFIACQALARIDPSGFGMMLKLADSAQKAILVAEMRQALHKRAVEGVENVKIGRIGKDLDGVVRDQYGKPIVERKYSDKLLEFGLSKLDKPTFGEQASALHIGAQVIYNISGLGVMPKPAIDAETIEAKPEAGENPATIDMRSLEDVD